jgi:hypothetical protein
LSVDGAACAAAHGGPRSAGAASPA